MKFIIILVLFSAAILGGCSSARRTEPIKEPVKLTNEKLVKGQKNYYRFCNTCHPNGEAGLGPALSNKSLLPGYLIKFQVRNGLGAMPSFSDEIIPPDQLDDIVEYIQYLQERD